MFVGPAQDTGRVEGSLGSCVGSRVSHVQPRVGCSRRGRTALGHDGRLGVGDVGRAAATFGDAVGARAHVADAVRVDGEGRVASAAVEASCGVQISERAGGSFHHYRYRLHFPRRFLRRCCHLLQRWA